MTTKDLNNYVTVLIPAYNESRHIGKTLESLAQEPLITETIVVDDGSIDQTAHIAGKCGARVIKLVKNRGKGGAIAAGYSYISNDTVLLLDADLQETAKKALVLTEPVLKGWADITIAGFKAERSGNGFGIARRTAVWGVKKLTGKTILFPLSGQRCLKKEVLGNLLPLAPRFGLEVGMTIDALKMGYRLLEIETDLSHNPPGRDFEGFAHRGKQCKDILLTLYSRSWRCRTH